jgi:hypothetical protein
MANDPNRTHEQEHPEPPAATGIGRNTIPGDPTEGSTPGRAAQERSALRTAEDTDEEAEGWDSRKESV